MEFYILKSGVCLAIFYSFYKLILEKESFHVFKRFYLVASLVLAFVIPLITFTEYIEVIPQEVPIFFQETPITNTIIEAEPLNHVPIILWSIYGLGVLLFGLKFLKNISELITKIRRNPKFKNHGFINVLMQDLVIPHTFLSFIFLNKQKFESKEIPKAVLLHEETHARQKHSLDVLFIELLQILFWFNPFIYFIKRSIKLNHEFLADQAVINKGISPSTYQQILLAFSSNALEQPLANAINYSSIKKRFTVMKTQTSKKAIWLRSLIILPLLAILIYSFSEKKVIAKPYVVQQKITANGVTETMMKEYRDFINDFESSNRIIYPKYLRAVAIYDLMTEEQRNTVKKYPKDIVSNLSNVEPKTPTEAEFNSWKDSNKFAIWIDGNHVKNSELNNYKASDIKYFANSFVHNNARSDKFPQSYQNHLYTQKGFETTFTNSKKDNSSFEKVKGENQQKATLYYNILILINHEGQLLLNDFRVEINNLKNSLNDLTKDLTDEQKRNILVNLKCSEEAPQEVITRVNTILSELKFLKFNPGQAYIYQPSLNEQEVTPQDIMLYNIIIKRNNSLPENERILKQHDLNFIMKIYGKMSEEQRAEAEPFGNLFPTPTPPSLLEPKNPSKELFNIKKEYNEKSNAYGEAMQSYFKEKKGSISDIWKMYYDTMIIYNKYSDLAKKELKSSKDLKKQDVPPPSFPPYPVEPKTPSKALLEAKKKYEEKVDAYGEAMQDYFKEKKGNLPKLWKMYDDGMILYKNYYDLAIEENPILPPPTSPTKKSSLDYIKEISKKEAIFNFEGKKLTSGEAINLLKKNPKLSIFSRMSNGINYIIIQKKSIKN